MNNPHKNARMTPLGRAEMIRRIVRWRPVRLSPRFWDQRSEQPQVAVAVAVGQRPGLRTARRVSDRKLWIGTVLADLAVRFAPRVPADGDEMPLVLTGAINRGQLVHASGLDGCPRSSRGACSRYSS